MDQRSEPQDELRPEDRRLLAELAETGFDPETMAVLTPAGRERGERLMGLLNLLRDYPVEDGDDTLVHATLARIDRYEEEQAARLSFDSRREESLPRRRIRVPDFISVAAVVLIALGVILPTVNHVRQKSLDTRCQDNLRFVGYAFSSYAGDNLGALPVARAGAFDSVANLLNLSPLVQGDYCDLGHLSCPGKHGDRASYSYQCQVPDVRMMWSNAPRAMVVLGDRNPLIDAYWSHEHKPPTTISINHGGRGQNVLRNDGVVDWLEQPLVAGGDNIWLPEGESELRRGAAPLSTSDVFLAH